MLKKINPILPEVLFVLREMGHGDQIALVDGNYPASAHANKLIRADGIELIPLLDFAIYSLLITRLMQL